MGAGLLQSRLQRCAHRWLCVGDRELRDTCRPRRFLGLLSLCHGPTLGLPLRGPQARPELQYRLSGRQGPYALAQIDTKPLGHIASIRGNAALRSLRSEAELTEPRLQKADLCVHALGRAARDDATHALARRL